MSQIDKEEFEPEYFETTSTTLKSFDDIRKNGLYLMTHDLWESYIDDVILKMGDKPVAVEKPNRAIIKLKKTESLKEMRAKVAMMEKLHTKELEKVRKEMDIKQAQLEKVTAELKMIKEKNGIVDMNEKRKKKNDEKDTKH